MSFCNALENELLDILFGKITGTIMGASNAPATVYVALSTTTPNDAGGSFTEPTDASYARVAVTNNNTNFPAASGGSKANGTDITFPTAAASWGTVTYFGVFTASSGGTPIATGALSTSKTPGSGDTLKFLAGDLVVTLD